MRSTGHFYPKKKRNVQTFLPTAVSDKAKHQISGHKLIGLNRIYRKTDKTQRYRITRSFACTIHDGY